MALSLLALSFRIVAGSRWKGERGVPLAEAKSCKVIYWGVSNPARPSYDGAVKFEIVGPTCENHSFRLHGKAARRSASKITSTDRSPLIPPLSFSTVELVQYTPSEI